MRSVLASESPVVPFEPTRLYATNPDLSYLQQPFTLEEVQGLIANADTENLVTLKLVLRLFSLVSGLQINYTKSNFVPLNISSNQITLISQLLSCQQTSFPVQYLGMPLSVVRPTRIHFMPLIKKLEKRLEGWKRKLISRGGKLQLVKSVLSAIPIYFMACFKLLKWVIDRIDRIRRAFLWGKSDSDAPGISLIDWDRACLPLRWGGLGIPNLEIRNTALLMRWWWKLYDEEPSLWKSVATAIRGVGIYANGPRIWAVRGSFFWMQLLSIRPMFIWSTGWRIGDGSAISYWFDAWGDALLVQPDQDRPALPNISLRDALPILHMLDPPQTYQVSLTGFV